jgi:hypothetical protein
MENKLELSKNACVSDYSFFNGTDLQKEIPKFSGLDLAKYINKYPNAQGLFVHELWRVGKIETVFDFFALPDYFRDHELQVDKIIYTLSYLVANSNMTVEECALFVRDLSFVSANAHEKQNFGDMPLYPEAVLERTEMVMSSVNECIASGDFNEYEPLM